MAFAICEDRVLLTMISPQEIYLPIRYLASDPKQSVLDHISPGILLYQSSNNLFRSETVEDFLSLGLKGADDHLGYTNWNLVQTLDKTPVRFVREFVERHAH
jgi:hypothetical protein